VSVNKNHRFYQNPELVLMYLNGNAYSFDEVIDMLPLKDFLDKYITPYVLYDPEDMDADIDIWDCHSKVPYYFRATVPVLNPKGFTDRKMIEEEKRVLQLESIINRLSILVYRERVIWQKSLGRFADVRAIACYEFLLEALRDKLIKAIFEFEKASENDDLKALTAISKNKS
jgi:hypothetical protein